MAANTNTTPVVASIALGATAGLGAFVMFGTPLGWSILIASAAAVVAKKAIDSSGA
jgi:hypothetical protein